MPRCLNCNEKFEKKYPTQIGKLRYCLLKDECIKAFYQAVNEKKKRAEQREWRKEKKQMSINAYSNKHKKQLQDNINKLARMIDSLFYNDCCCCHLKLDKRTAGAHYHSVGSNETLRFHLHNIHKSTYHCNNHKSTHHKDYANKLKERYNNEYYEYVEYTLQQHPIIKLTEQQIYDLKILTNKIIREFDSYEFKDPLIARDFLNEKIGIYKPRK